MTSLTSECSTHDKTHGLASAVDSISEAEASTADPTTNERPNMIAPQTCNVLMSAQLLMSAELDAQEREGPCFEIMLLQELHFFQAEQNMMMQILKDQSGADSRIDKPRRSLASSEKSLSQLDASGLGDPSKREKLRGSIAKAASELKRVQYLEGRTMGGLMTFSIPRFRRLKKELLAKTLALFTTQMVGSCKELQKTCDATVLRLDFTAPVLAKQARLVLANADNLMAGPSGLAVKEQLEAMEAGVDAAEKKKEKASKSS